MYRKLIRQDNNNQEPIHMCVQTSDSSYLAALLAAPHVKVDTMWEGKTCLALLCLRIQNLLPGNFLYQFNNRQD